MMFRLRPAQQHSIWALRSSDEALYFRVSQLSPIAWRAPTRFNSYIPFAGSLKSLELSMKPFNTTLSALALALAFSLPAFAQSTASPCPYGMTLTLNPVTHTQRCIGVPIRMNQTGTWTANGQNYTGLAPAAPSPYSIGPGPAPLAPATGYTSSIAQSGSQDWTPNAGMANDVVNTSQGFVASVAVPTGDEIDQFIEWRMRQPNPFGGGTIGDSFRAQGADPYGAQSRAQAQEMIERQQRREAIYAGAGRPGELVSEWSLQGQALQADRDARVAARDASNQAWCDSHPGSCAGSVGPGPAAASPSAADIAARMARDPAYAQAFAEQNGWTPDMARSWMSNAAATAPAPAPAPAPAAAAAPAPAAAPQGVVGVPVGSFCAPWGNRVTYDFQGTHTDTGGPC